MLQKLSIQNFILIETLELDFSKGLTVITGETGAGKSILLGALHLILGERADPKVLLDEGKKCTIEAIFDIKNYNLKEWFQDADIDYETDLIVRREIAVSGRSRAFVNDTPVGLKQLRELCSQLVDLHQQFDTLDIHDPVFHVKLLDALAENKVLLATYKTKFREYASLQKKLKSLVEQEKQANQEADFFQFNLDELLEAQLDEAEQESLEKELKLLESSKEIIQVLNGIRNGLTEEDPSIVSSLQMMNSQLIPLGNLDKKLEAVQHRFQNSLIELEDLANEFEQLGEQMELDEERILEVQQRLDTIYRLQNKHRVNSNKELLDIQEDLEQKLTTFNSLSNDIAALEKEIQANHKTLTAQANTISTRRLKVSKSYIVQVEQMLADLGMPKARLETNHSKTELSQTGCDWIEFKFSANGNRMESIKQAASGGEVSRLALSMKSLVAAAIPLPTMIFDEIDSGISGTVSLKLGQILNKLAHEHQIIMITHSPQVAAQGHKHLFVHKKEKADKVYSHVKPLNKVERIEEIATMLSSSPPSDFAIKNAKELLGLEV